MGAWIIRILNFASASLNLQLKLRVPAHLRATLYGLCLALLGFSLYRGWISEAEGGVILALLGTIFTFSIQKTAEGDKISVSISQVNTSARPESGTATPFTNIIASPVLAGNAQVVVKEEKALELVKAGEVKSRPITVAEPTAPTVVVPPAVVIPLGEEFDKRG